VQAPLLGDGTVSLLFLSVHRNYLEFSTGVCYKGFRITSVIVLVLGLVSCLIEYCIVFYRGSQSKLFLLLLLTIKLTRQEEMTK